MTEKLTLTVNNVHLCRPKDNINLEANSFHKELNTVFVLCTVEFFAKIWKPQSGISMKRQIICHFIDFWDLIIVFCYFLHLRTYGFLDWSKKLVNFSQFWIRKILKPLDMILTTSHITMHKPWGPELWNEIRLPHSLHQVSRSVPMGMLFNTQWLKQTGLDCIHI